MTSQFDKADNRVEESEHFRGAVRGGPITDHVNEFKAFTNHVKYDFTIHESRYKLQPVNQECQGKEIASTAAT
jgi:hypothetical protein